MKIQILIFSLSFVTFLPQLDAQNDSYVANDNLTSNLSYSSLLAFGELSPKVVGGGLKFCSSVELSKSTRFSIGPSVFIERSYLAKHLEEKNVKEAHITLLSPGVNAKYQLNKNSYIQFDLTLIAGLETRVRYTPRASGRMEEDPRALSGLQFEQSFLSKTLWKKKGLLGIAFFERIIDSDINHLDAGAKLYVGLGW